MHTIIAVDAAGILPRVVAATATANTTIAATADGASGGERSGVVDAARACARPRPRTVTACDRP
jgi:hypothetical protein